jgi:hypothetical protein
MAEEEKDPRVLLARQFTVGVAGTRVTLTFDYKNAPRDTSEFQLGLSLPSAIARLLARQILEAADKAASQEQT